MNNTYIIGLSEYQYNFMNKFIKDRLFLIKSDDKFHVHGLDSGLMSSTHSIETAISDFQEIISDINILYKEYDNILFPTLKDTVLSQLFNELYMKVEQAFFPKFSYLSNYFKVESNFYKNEVLSNERVQQIMKEIEATE